MKHFQLLPLTLFITVLSFGQNTKGDFSLYVQAAPYPTFEFQDFGLIGIAGAEYFVSEKFSLSTSLFTSNNTLFKGDRGPTIRSYGVIPSLQYYFINKEKWNLFGQAGYGFGFEDVTNGVIQNSALTVVDLGVGAEYKIGEKLFLRLLVPYFHAQNITINQKAVAGVAPFFGFAFKM